MKSDIDKLYEKIFGHSLSKPGAALERFAALATYLLEGQDVTHDDRLKGSFSDTTYQLDIHHTAPNKGLMGEAKDYSIHNSKVGRGDLQKLVGALGDLNHIDEGSFFSATGYTKPAKQYAEAAQQIVGKPIMLYGLRQSTHEDENGFIQTIAIDICIENSDFKSAQFIPHFTENAYDMLLQQYENQELHIILQELFNSKGECIITIQELTATVPHGSVMVKKDTNHYKGSYLLPNHFISIKGELFEIQGIEYSIPYSVSTISFEITDDSEVRVVLLDKNNSPIKIFRDKVLQDFYFDNNGKVIRK